MSGVSRVSIPNTVKKTIENIKEISGNHSDEEIYAMLKECSMDPNETAQKLLFQDTFHEVKRKRDKKKEINRETSGTRWRPASQGRVGRGGRGNYNRYASHDLESRRNIDIGKENEINEDGDKDSASASSLVPLATENKTTTGENNSDIPISSMANGPINTEQLPSDKPIFIVGTSNDVLSPVAINTCGSSIVEKDSLSSGILISSLIATVVDASKHEVGTPLSIVDADTDIIVSHESGDSKLLQERAASEKSYTFDNGNIQESFLDIEGEQALNTSHAPSPSSSVSGTSGSRPSSNYSSRSQHPGAHIKAGPAKEWKPKATTVNPTTVSVVINTTGADFSTGDSTNFIVLDNTAKIQKKLEDLLISDTKHVIFPDHLQVSESERNSLSFGSFDSNFGLPMRFKNETDSTEIPGEPSELLIEMQETNEELPSRCSTADSSKVTEESNYEDDSQPSMPDSQNRQSVLLDFGSSMPPAVENDQSKTVETLASEGLQRSVVHSAPVYSNFGFVSPMLGSHFAAFESADLPAHETARLPSFIVPQPFDPSANYYASIYRPAIDGDGRFSPLLAPGASSKYNGTVAVLPAQTGQSLQESGVLPSIGSPPLLTQAAGIAQSSIAAGQQPLPVFRQPAGVHISHYPPNFIHYNQYFSPFYVPPHAAIHHFLGNAAAFPQQPPPGSLFPLPTAAAGPNPVKYPISQYKPATGFNPAVYGSAVSGGNSTGNEDLASQFKDNSSVFMTGQQSEGSTVWMTPPARDLSPFQAGSFYNIPPQGQPVAFAPAQAGPAAATFAGIYHPTPTVAVGSVHPLLQQSQTVGGASQINWVNNY